MQKGTKKTRNALVASAVALTLSCAMLLGTTFAWFTDSVTNKGNVIQAGNLSITATAYDVDPEGTGYTIDDVNGGKPFGFKADGKDLKDPDCGAIISENMWEPGISDAKLITVTNDGDLATKIQLNFITKNTDANGAPSTVKLEDALWFDFVQVSAEGTTTGSFEKRQMSQLQSLASNLTYTLPAKGASVSFILVYGMNEDAGNKYQNLKFSADVTVLATQAPVEADGFGNKQYDANADATPDHGDWNQNKVYNEQDLAVALAEGGNVTLGQDITLTAPEETDGSLLQVTKNTVLDLGDYTLSAALTDGQTLLEVKNGATLTLTGNTTEEGTPPKWGVDIGTNDSVIVRLTDNSQVLIQGGNYRGAMIAKADSGKTIVTKGYFNSKNMPFDGEWSGKGSFDIVIGFGN